MIGEKVGLDGFLRFQPACFSPKPLVLRVNLMEWTRIYQGGRADYVIGDFTSVHGEKGKALIRLRKRADNWETTCFRTQKYWFKEA